MESMTTQERLDDICNISGLSENVVRRVIEAERESIVNSLKRGEKAILIGRAIITPEIRSKLQVGGTIKQFIKVKAKVSNSLEHMLEDMSSFEIDDAIDNSGIDTSKFLTRQIDSLI